jgi:hypothetical protein
MSLLLAPALLAICAFGVASEPIALAPEDGLLVLKNGEVIAGKITQSGNRYYVALPHGELRLRSEDVALRCKDLPDGYAKKRAALAGNRADEHHELAQWCLNQGLLDEAETEIRHAATIDRGHPRLRLLARRLELARTKPVKAAPTAVIVSPMNAGPDLEELGKSIPLPVLQKFTTTVQPLLLNSCANGNCHGVASKSSFTIAKIRGQGDRARRQTLRNLMAVLDQIDRQQPQKSPLLTKPIEPHGGGKAPIFTARNSRQYYELYEWVRHATGGNRSLPESPSREATALNANPDTMTDEEVEAAAFEESETLAPAETTAEDPYDAEEFNREFGGAE